MPHADRDDFFRQFGRAVRRARLDKGMTQAELGLPLDLTRASVANIEAGRQHCSLHAAVILARHLDVPLEELLPGQDNSSVPALNPALDRYKADIALVLRRSASDTARAKDGV